MNFNNINKEIRSIRNRNDQLHFFYKFFLNYRSAQFSRKKTIWSKIIFNWWKFVIWTITEILEEEERNRTEIFEVS